MMAGLQARPDRVVIAIAVLSWTWMLGEAATAQRLSCCEPYPSRSDDLGSWILMVGAMMLPTAIPAIRDVATRSYRRRRILAVLEYILGYTACWLPVGVAFVLLRSCEFAHDLRAAVALCLLAAAWALLPIRAYWFVRCHRQIPLCPAGARADLDAMRQGAVHGVPCIKMCWPLMFACAISGHDLALMIGGASLAAAEKRMFRLDRKPLVLGALALGAWIFVKWMMIRQA